MWQCRISNTLGGGFAGTPNKAWGTKPYGDKTKPCVFFGVYGLPDLMAIREHKGKKAILWAGTDVTYLINGYWLDEVGKYRLDPLTVGHYLSETCDNWCENVLEQAELASVGIKAKVQISYLGSLNVKPTKQDPKKAYISVSGNDFKAYGWDKLDEIALLNPDNTYYCYGNTKPYKFKAKNIVVRGRVSQKQMDKEISKMGRALRLNEHDGFSEIIAKALLREQCVVSSIPYPFMGMKPDQARKWFLRNVNRYPWKK